MKKPAALAEMIARKAFSAPQFQQSWQAHVQAFGPILLPAYADCYTAKVHLTNILNKISRGDVDGAKAVMETLTRSCGCDTPEEKALLCFLEGLCCEVTGNRMGMFSKYDRAGDYGHRFYLLHLKNGKFALESGELDIALAEYTKALPLLRELPEGPARAKLLGSALTNTASCLTYMHRYADAEAALAEARATGPVSRIETVEAVLYAATGKETEMEACLAALTGDPEYDHICALVRSILEGRDPHFTVQPVDENAVSSFWHWFAENEESLLALYNQQDEELPEEFILQLDAHMEPCFPFEHAPLEIAGHKEADPPELSIFTDGYHRSLKEGCGVLFAACPADIAARWEFTVEH